ncbi:unnamed protein product [Meloidogyne enterolobii]|uniref:Uncharacterized protein n=1 Tax=Meloidogyne enterolobii TaxID=390850 RepID=A0ACB0ZK75_MELEN
MNFSNEETNEEETKQRMLSLDYGSAATAANVWLHHSASAGHIPPCNNNIEAMDNSIPLNSSPLSTSSNGNAAEMRSSNDGDAEGVWSPDIDQAFHEALQIYPQCGRRKIILSDEGKMYGRNELIARYIKLRCGKSRTRKQVSSHIQVLARKKQREEHSRIKTQRDNTLPETNANSSSASTTSSVSNNHTTASVSATILPSSNNSLQQQKQIKKAESEDLIIGHSLPSNSLNILPSSPNNQIQNISLAVAASQQPLANLITSINRDQIASVQAQVARAASAISQQNWPSLIVTNNNNNQHLMAGAQLYMAASSNPCSSVVASIPAAFVSNGNCQLNTNSSSSEQIIFTTTPSSAFTCATTINTKMTTIASPNLILNGFTAYIEEQQNLIKNRERREEMMEEESIGQQRIELVHIPKNSETPFERISLELIQSKYPPILQELFKRGPSDAFFLAKCWANMNFEINDEQNALFAVDSYYESNFGRFDIIVSTKVCSFGNEVVEKVEIYSPIEEDEDIKPSSQLWHFRLEKSPMCEYMVRFISELKKLQEPSLMNSVLENFTILQIVSNKQSEETLMVIAFIFEVREDGEDEIYTNIYRLTE